MARNDGHVCAQRLVNKEQFDQTSVEIHRSYIGKMTKNSHSTFSFKVICLFQSDINKIKYIHSKQCKTILINVTILAVFNMKP